MHRGLPLAAAAPLITHALTQLRLRRGGGGGGGESATGLSADSAEAAGPTEAVAALPGQWPPCT